jgi:hypothetical protein
LTATAPPLSLAKWPLAKSRARRLLHSVPRFVLLVAVLLIPCTGKPYSLLTHQQLIDLTWQHSIRPLLLSRYPKLTESDLLVAHAYAYGGCAIQDLGYYPFGNSFFSDLTHYVRTGDFVTALFRNSTNANELAFSIGALSHYLSDNIGHSESINTAVAIEFPKLAKKYGPEVTYEDAPHAHIRTEFAFDVNEIAKNRFAPVLYVKHIGLRIPQPLLEKAFFQTYGLNMRSALHYSRPVIKGYRFGVRSFIPRFAYAEALLHKNHFPPDTPGEPNDRLKADLAHAERDNHWGAYSRKPTFGTYVFAGIIFILPKVGVLSDLAIRGPRPETEVTYVDSFNRSIDALRNSIAHFSNIPTSLANRDLDNGLRIRPGGYRLADNTYAKLLHILLEQQKDHPEQIIPTGLKENVLTYYANPDAPITTRKDPRKWAKVQEELVALKTIKDTPNPPFVPGPDPDLPEPKDEPTATR